MDGYEKAIINGLKTRGHTVHYFPGGTKIKRDAITLGHRAIRSLVREYGFKPFGNYLDHLETVIYSERLNELGNCYDYIFDFGGKANENCLRLLKKKYDCPFILYLWDDFCHVKDAKKKTLFFDRVNVFSKTDAENYGFVYRPNFFVDEYLYSGEPKTIDLFYKGSARDKKRSVIIDQLARSLPDRHTEISLAVRGGYLRNMHRMTNQAFFKKFCTTAHMTVSELAAKYKQSRALLDISFKDQRGLGLRPLESIACNAKLITTNKSIREYDFFNDNNVFVLNEDCSNIDLVRDFLDSPFVPYNDSVKYKYSVRGFLDDVFNGL